MRVLLVILTFLSLQSAFALEIDEKLTLRFLKVSSSKKTILINRGAEDGLVVGDHAKFFVTTGVLARGVVEKVSPSRSVWSLYRIVDPNEIAEGKVLNLKIASPVKITEDPSKSVAEEATSAGTEKMGTGEGGAVSEKPNVSSEAEEKEFEEMGIEDKGKTAQKEKPKNMKEKSTKSEEYVPVHSGVNTSKSWELWGTMYMSALTGAVEDPSANTTNTSSASSTTDLSLGIEKYFLVTDDFFKNISITVFLHKKSLRPGGTDKLTMDWLEFGAGGNYHFYNSAAMTDKLIGFGGINFGMGSATSSTTGSDVDATVTKLNITNTFFSLGVGAKYLLNSGFGARALLDYYRTSESYKNSADETVKRTLSGPRMQFGISYRF